MDTYPETCLQMRALQLLNALQPKWTVNVYFNSFQLNRHDFTVWYLWCGTQSLSQVNEMRFNITACR